MLIYTLLMPCLWCPYVLRPAELNIRYLCHAYLYITDAYLYIRYCDAGWVGILVMLPLSTFVRVMVTD